MTRSGPPDDDPLVQFAEIMLQHMEGMGEGDVFNAPDVIDAFLARQPAGAMSAERDQQLRAIAEAVYRLAAESVSNGRRN